MPFLSYLVDECIVYHLTLQRVRVLANTVLTVLTSLINANLHRLELIDTVSWSFTQIVAMHTNDASLYIDPNRPEQRIRNDWLIIAGQLQKKTIYKYTMPCTLMRYLHNFVSVFDSTGYYKRHWVFRLFFIRIQVILIILHYHIRHQINTFAR